jgi:antitoxin VapB
VQTAKIFKYGNSQAVRLPKEFRFEGTEVHIKRTPSRVLLIPKKTTPEQVEAVFAHS